MKLRMYMLSLFSVAMASFLLFNFTMIWVLGRFVIYESNRYVLLFETAMFISILVFSFSCFLEQIKRIDK
jgi:hypothetical protein